MSNFQKSIATSFSGLRTDRDLLDVTVQCGGTALMAHKLVLSTCSGWFKDVFRSLPPTSNNPVVALWEASPEDMSSILDFIYYGEVNVKQEQLASFLALAEKLQVRGLTDNTCPETGGAKPDSAKRSERQPAEQQQQRLQEAKDSGKRANSKVHGPPDAEQGGASKKFKPDDPDIEEVAVVKLEVGQPVGGQPGDGQMALYEEDYEVEDTGGVQQDFSISPSQMGNMESAKGRGSPVLASFTW